MKNELKNKEIIYNRMKEIKTWEEFKPYFEDLMKNPIHGYGECCYQIAAAATVIAMILSDEYGITVFQAGAVMWEFMKEFNHVEYPAKLVRYEDMMYPQYKGKFGKIISSGTWEWIQEETRKKFDEIDRKSPPHPDVELHWKNILAGIVPFGYKVTGD